MFSKAIAVFLLAASAIAGVIPEGTYLITNVASRTTARVFSAGDQIYVGAEHPGQFELWNLKNARDNGYTIQNVGVGTFAAVSQSVNGEPVVTDQDATVFDIEDASNGAFVIKLLNGDFLWNVEPPVTPYGNVALRPANGENTEHWVFTPRPAQG